MPLEKRSKYDIVDIAKEFDVSVEDLLSLINGSVNSSNQRKNITISFIISEYRSFLSKQLSLGKKSILTLKRCFSFFNRFEKFIESHYDGITLGELNEVVLNEFFSYYSGKNGGSLSAGTTNNYTSIVRAMLKYAYRMDLTDKDYTYKFSWEKVANLPRYIQHHQLKNVFAAALQKINGYRSHAILTFLAGTGCRVSEVSNLRINDFDIERNVIFIRNGKGNKDRPVPMYPKVKKVILDYLHLTGVKEWRSDLKGYLFSKDYGLERNTKISTRSIQDMCKSIFDKLGYEGLTVHSFRHTFAVGCLKMGMSIDNLSMVLGHTNINTTYIYVQLFPHDLRDEVTKKYPFAFEDLISQVLNWSDVHEKRK